MIDETERLRRWRLILGKSSEMPLNGSEKSSLSSKRKKGKGKGQPNAGLPGQGLPNDEEDSQNTDIGDQEGDVQEGDVQEGEDEDDQIGRDLGMDNVLEALYDSDRDGGLGSSSPNVVRWLGDIRTYFPGNIVKVMQQDALDRLKLTEILLDPEALAVVEVDVHLIATLLTLSKVIPEETKETARHVVRKMVDEIEKKLENKLIQAIRGSLNKFEHTFRPRFNEIDWQRTIRANLKNYIPEYETIIPERLIGYSHKRSALHDVVICVDQSGSMATSVVYSAIFASVLFTMNALKTRMVAFDTSIVDLTDDLHDPVDVLFGTQLGGGTDIGHALSYCQQIITKPTKTILVLVTDLYEGSDTKEMFTVLAELINSGVQVICLLALSDKGTPAFNHENAATLANMNIPTFACTPDLFPDLMAAAIKKQDLNLWAAKNDIVTIRPEQ